MSDHHHIYQGKHPRVAFKNLSPDSPEDLASQVSPERPRP